MIPQFLQDAFPHLESEGFLETSPATKKYNCIAWVANDINRWWWAEQNEAYYWPESVERVVTLEAFVAAFATVGYERCDNEDLDPGCEKIAIFTLNGKPTHAARQLADGHWTSKLGKYIDITHTLRGLNGPAYGQAVAYMKRPNRKS